MRSSRAGVVLATLFAGTFVMGSAELVVVGAPRRRAPRKGPIFGGTVEYVLKASPSRVLVAGGRMAA